MLEQGKTQRSSPGLEPDTDMDIDKDTDIDIDAAADIGT